MVHIYIVTVAFSTGVPCFFLYVELDERQQVHSEKCNTVQTSMNTAMTGTFNTDQDNYIEQQWKNPELDLNNMYTLTHSLLVHLFKRIIIFSFGQRNHE